MRRDLDRFDNYRQITARFASTASCGHEVKKGDTVGYNAPLKKVQCTACWYNWCAENRQAQAYEDTGSDCAYDY